MKQTRQSKPRVDLTDKLFTYLTPKYYIKGGKWHCICKCGNELDVDTRNLNSGHTTSCGCRQKEIAGLVNTTNMLNYEDNNLKVISQEKSDSQGIAQWQCLCKHCGNVFITRGSSIRAGYVQSCGCIHSRGEQKITKILLENNIEFCTQYTFPNLKDKNHLRFDFAIFNKGVLSHLIEFNGKQHYEQADGAWADGFELLQLHDNQKQKYCEENNIRLVIIKYDEQITLEKLM